MDYSVKEICAIIKACKENGVNDLAIGELKLSFASRVPEPEKPRPPTSEEIAAAKDYENDVFLENEKRIKEDHLAHLRLSDPEAYEELIERGELLHAGEKSDGVDAS